MEQEHDKGGSREALVILAALVGFVVCAVARSAAVRGASYKTTKVLIFPVAWILTQVVAVGIAMPLALIVCMFSKTAGNAFFGSISDLALLGFIFHENTTPIIAIILYQFAAWLVLGRMFTRAFTIGIYDSAIQVIGLNEGVHPYYVRERVLQSDAGYAEAYAIYQKKGTVPQIGMILVGLSQTPLNEYY